MGFGRALRGLGGAALAGALVVGVAPVAHADSTRDEQWALTVYLAAKNVWPHDTGKGVTVAVIDTGVRATHVDLAGQVLPGTDFAFGGKGWTDHSSEGHGTAIASLIAGHGHGPDGSDGVKGLAPDAKVLPIGIGTGVAGAGPDYIPQAIHYAVDHGAQVINISLAGASPSDQEEQAVAYAERHNVVVVAGAGNEGVGEPQYPASYPGVIKVGAVDKSGSLWNKSDTGGVTVVAPGVGIVCDGGYSDTGYAKGDGTSMATAYVSAIAALYRSAHPDLTAGQIVNYVIKTAVPAGGVKTPDPGYGYGIASPALTMAVGAGPTAGPLPQATLPAATPSTGAAAIASGSGSSSGTVLVLVGLGVLVLVVVVVVVVVRGRRGGGGGGTGTGGGAEPGYPTHPRAQQAFPPQQGHDGNQVR